MQLGAITRWMPDEQGGEVRFHSSMVGRAGRDLSKEEAEAAVEAFRNLSEEAPLHRPLTAPTFTSSP